VVWCPSYLLGRSRCDQVVACIGPAPAELSEHAQTESPPFGVRGCSEMGFRYPQAPAVAELMRVCAIVLTVLSGSSPAQRDAVLHGRPVEV
jgi:hypothetical protein